MSPDSLQPNAQQDIDNTRVISNELSDTRSLSATRPRILPPMPVEQEDDADEPVEEKKRSGRMGFLPIALYVILIAGVSTLLATLIWVSANDVLSLMKDDITASIEVTESDTVQVIADKLAKEKIIQYPFLFELYCSFTDSQEKIDPGHYEINADMDYHAIVAAMSDTSKYRSIVSVTIPEGYEMKSIFALLEEKGVCKRSELEEVAANYDFTYEYIKILPKGKYRLEGYLFPDTYEFYINDQPVTAVKKLLNNFDRKLTAQLRERAAELGVSINDAVTIASLIEKEAANNKERPTIASVIYNRLNSKTLKRLQIDATIQYILPQRKAKLSIEDTEIDNPYNTYLHDGLPPGPIASPGIESLTAALYPEKTGYYYYALDSEGTHKFSKTFKEHQAFLAEQKNAG